MQQQLQQQRLQWTQAHRLTLCPWQATAAPLLQARLLPQTAVACWWDHLGRAHRWCAQTHAGICMPAVHLVAPSAAATVTAAPAVTGTAPNRSVGLLGLRWSQLQMQHTPRLLQHLAAAVLMYSPRHQLQPPSSVDSRSSSCWNHAHTTSTMQAAAAAAGAVMHRSRIRLGYQQQQSGTKTPGMQQPST